MTFSFTSPEVDLALENEGLELVWTSPTKQVGFFNGSILFLHLGDCYLG